MEIKKLDWDSQFFGFPVGEILIEKDFSHSIKLNTDVFKFFQVKSTFPLDIISDTHVQSYWETKIIFKKQITENQYLTESILDFDEFPLPEKSLYHLAYESGKYSRYKQDKNFSEGKFKQLYELWIVNSINKSFADKIFYHKENEEILGFVTLKIIENNAQIGLIAVSPNTQGRGLGKKLLQYAENFCYKKNIKTLFITTQLENAPACNFYTKMGYEISDKTIIKHFWKNENR